MTRAEEYRIEFNKLETMLKKQSSTGSDTESQEAQDLYEKTMLFGIDSKESLETVSIGLAIAMTTISGSRWEEFQTRHGKALEPLDDEQVEILRGVFTELISTGHKMYWTEKVKIKQESYDNFTRMSGPRFMSHLESEYKRYFSSDEQLETFPEYLLKASDKFGHTMINALSSQHDDIIKTLVEAGNSKLFAKLIADMKQVAASLVFSGYVLSYIQDEFVESLGVEDSGSEAESLFDTEDDLYEDVREYVADLKTVSTASLQRRFRIGYARASRLLGKLEEDGLISQRDADSGARKVL